VKIMTSKKLITGIAVLTLITAGYLSVGRAFAYQGDYTQKGPNCTTERHEIMMEAFANKDYNAWSSVMQGRGRISQVINEGNFSRFAEAHDLAQNGDYEGAEAIRQELGLRGRDGVGVGAKYMGGGQGRGQRSGVLK
jgi:hypothetical protein